MHPWEHALSHARQFGGKPEDYLEIDNFLDSSKVAYCDWRHRALLHHSFGCFLCEQRFGVTITNSDGQQVPVRVIAEAHIVEDLGFVPSVQDWLEHLQPPANDNWMRGNPRLRPAVPPRKARHGYHQSIPNPPPLAGLLRADVLPEENQLAGGEGADGPGGDGGAAPEGG